MSDESVAKGDLLLVGVGGTGCELAARCRGAGARRFLDFDARALGRYDDAEIISLVGDADDTDDMSPESMRHTAADAAERLASLADGHYGLVVLLGAVGGQTGSLVLPTLARELKDSAATTVVAAIEPMPFEGATRGEMASRALAELEQAADLLLTVPNRPLADLCDAALPVGQALECLKLMTVEAVGQLLEALSDGSCVGLQPSELRRSLLHAGRGAFGVGVGRGQRRVEEALRDACAHSFLTQQSCQQASAAILHLRGGKDLSLQEVHSATELVAHMVGRVAVQVGLSTTGGDADEVRATLLVTGIQPPKPSDDPLASLGQYEDLGFHEGVDLDVPAFLRRKSSVHLTR